MNSRILKNLTLTLLCCALISCATETEQGDRIDLLILSGRNNHDWEQTTTVLLRNFEQQGIFRCSVTTRPDTLTYDDLKRFDAILSNWNSWPENDLRWPGDLETGLLQYLEEGGGLVFFHSSTSVFYTWPEFREITTASWEDRTHHGAMCPVRVSIRDREHPVTAGLSDFYIHDELWIDARENDKFRILGTASKETKDAGNTGDKGNAGDLAEQPAIFVAEQGKGRIFHTILGHDARALRNTGLKTLLARGTEWAARGEVTIGIPQELQRPADRVSAEGSTNDLKDYSWLQNDTAFALLKGGQIVWKYNFNNIKGKPFFHPIYLHGNRITCESPDDHPWHLGQWFSWKYISGKNFWEYLEGSYESEGMTRIREIDCTRENGFGATIRLEIGYLVPGEEPVMKESRTIKVEPPGQNRVQMDYTMEFTALSDSVLLDRTPILGEVDGKSWGGYAGLNIRFNQDLMETGWISGSVEDTAASGSTGNWLYMGFTGIDGKRVGSAMFISPETRRNGAAWYLIDNSDLPFYYFSPAYLYLKPLMMRKGDLLKLKYRVLHLEGNPDRESLEREFMQYAYPEPI